MMDNMMTGGMAAMGWGMALFCLLVAVVLVFAAAALVRYLFFNRRDRA